MAAPKSGLRGIALRAGFALALFLVSLELGLRAVFPVPELANFDRHTYRHGGPERGLRLAEGRPRRLMTWGSVPDGFAFGNTLNAYSFRDRERRVEPAPGVHRVAFFGDSFVEGLGSSDDHTITAAFEDEAAQAGLEVEALNFGIQGTDLTHQGPLVRDAVAVFAPREVFLVVYANDLYRLSLFPADPSGWADEAFVPTRTDPLEPRILWVRRRLRQGLPLIYRWPLPGGDFKDPAAMAAFFESKPGLRERMDENVDPEIAAYMRTGELNPALVDLAVRMEGLLPRAITPRRMLEALQRLAERGGAELRVVFLPSLLQVSDAYLDAQLRISAPPRTRSFTGPIFRQHARELARVCRDLGLAFRDLTPDLQAQERRGRRLYWAFDSHMRPEGYDFVGRVLFEWWRDTRAQRTLNPRDASRAPKEAEGRGSSR